MVSKRLELIFMNMVSAVLIAIFYKTYNVPSRYDVREIALRCIEKFQDAMTAEVDNL